MWSTLPDAGKWLEFFARSDSTVGGPLRHYSEALAKDLLRHHAMPGEGGSKIQILLTSVRVLRNGQIVNLQTPAPHETRILTRYQNQSIAPAIRKDGGSLINSMGVVAKLPLKGRALSDSGIYQVAALDARARVNVRFVGNQKLGRSVRVLTQNCLTSDHDDVIVIGDRSSRSNDVLQLRARHGWLARCRSNCA